MLTPVKTTNPARFKGGRFAIVASLYNDRFVSSMLGEVKKVLAKAGAVIVQEVRVPGAFEIPVVASRLAHSTEIEVDAIICLGVVMRGETKHADHIVEGVTHALATLQIGSGIAVIHGVYLFDSHFQAEARCVAPKFNRGKELAMTALHMAKILSALPKGGNE